MYRMFLIELTFYRTSHKQLNCNAYFDHFCLHQYRINMNN